MDRKLLLVFIACALSLVSLHSVSQSLNHPHIWVKDSDKSVILDKINQYTWAENLFNQYKSRVDPKKNSHKTNPETILNTIPSFPGDKKKHLEALTLGYEAALLYWLTGNNDYGQLAADILYHYTKKISAISGTVHFSSGVSYSHLIDTREAYTKPPLIYDFSYAFLKKSTTKVYDLDSKTKVSFNFTKAQNTFIKLADGVFNEGSINSNHPILEAPGALFNLLSIEDDAKRKSYLTKFMNGTAKQNGLTWMMDECKKSGVWPEATGYSIGPHRIILELMIVVDHYDPSMKVIEGNKDLVKNAFFFENYKFPNNRNVMRFGDAHRDRLNTVSILERILKISTTKSYGTLKNDSYKMLQALYKDKGGYNPKVSTQSLEWNNPYYLLWGENISTSNITPITYNSSINIDYAGIAMQRNINTSDPEEYGLMGYIGGAHYVHSHLTGIDMEIYGSGAVVGTGGGDVGASDRNDDVFRNYHRIYAGHNTVIVNGTSKGEGKGSWKADNQLLQNTAKTVAAEPASLVDPISEEFTFSTQVLDDKINDAKQERVFSVVRTSDKTGYYFDMFRSKSLTTNNFHDYVYHNVGDGVNIVDENNNPVSLASKTGRYTSIRSDYGGKYVMFPGWHYFESVKTSAKTTKGIKATIPMTKSGKQYMHMLMPGGENREYTSCKGPATIEAQVGYEDVKTPIVTVRHYGEAWTKPFISVFEPTRNENGSVKSVENLYSGSKIVGAIVTSVVDGETITDYVISNINADDTFALNSPAITFKGRFAIVRESAGTAKLYIGDGTSLTYKSETLTATNRKGVKEVSIEACNIIIDQNFNHWDDKTYTVADAKSDFNNKVKPWTASTYRGISAPGADASLIGDVAQETRIVNGELRAEYKKDDAGGYAGGFLFDPYFDGVEEAYLEYKVKFDDNFFWATGGKLPGLGGSTQGINSETTGRGAIPSGGRYDENGTGFSARLMWRRNRDQTNDPYFILYSYFAEKPDGTVRKDGDAGDAIRIFTGLEDNKWYTIKQYIKLNTPGQDDGTVIMWIDGVEVYKNKTHNIRQAGKDDLKINALIMNTYRGGSRTDTVWHSPRDEFAFFDDFKVWTNCTNPDQGENVPPVVSFINPESGDITVEEGYKLYVNAQVEDENLEKTELFINGNFVRKESVAPYEWGIVGSPNAEELNNLPVGKHTITVVATDVEGLTGEASFTLNVELPNYPPVISLVAPTSADTIVYEDYTLTLEALVEDDNLAYTVLYINGDSIRKESVAPYEWGHAGSPNVDELNGLPIGDHSIQVFAVDEKGARSSAGFTLMVRERKEPYFGSPIIIPGTIEMENYDKGGEGISFHDTDNENKGTIYRTDGVDIGKSASGAFTIGYTSTGEWLEYTVSVQETGLYTFSFNCSSLNGGGLIGAQIGETILFSGVSVPKTDAWGTYIIFSHPSVQLEKGEQVIRFLIEKNGFNIDKIEVEKTSATQTIALKQGWNLISFYIKPIESLTGTVFPNATTIKTLDGFWSSSQPSYLNSLTTIEAGFGYLVYNSVDETVVINGNLVDPILGLDIDDGWNLVGVPSASPIPVSDVPDAIIIKDFDAFYEKGNNLSSLKELLPGKAYYIKK